MKIDSTIPPKTLYIFQSICLVLTVMAACFTWYNLGKMSVYNEQINKMNIEMKKNMDEIERLNIESSEISKKTNDLYQEVKATYISDEPYPSEPMK
ncbi:hypothetical protein ACT4XR_20025 (plasmid) [Acinetobacter baumannii]|uniref:hypothetical protein n=1 Tax=Acinetobacter baumannii TaxID=470 RepID=UPI003891C74A